MTDQPFGCEQARIIMMGLIDNEVNPEERNKFEAHIKQCPACAKEYREFSNLKEETGNMKLAKLPDERWDAYWTNVYNRLERGIGWIFFSIGAIIAISYSAYVSLKEFFNNPDISLVLKIGIASLLLGSIILVISVFREKLVIKQLDKYRRIKR